MEEITIINKHISKELWYDFEVKFYDGFTLTMIGGIDLYYKWLIEITFSDVPFLMLKSDWKKNRKLDAIEIIKGKRDESIRKLYYIEDGNYLFGLNHEDADADNSNQYIIAAKQISYKLNK